MYSGFESSYEEKLARGIRWSLIGHGLVFSLAIIKSLVFPSEVKPYVPVLRVDMVGLPDLTKEEMRDLKEAAKEAAEKQESQATPAPAEKDSAEEMALQQEKAAEKEKAKKLKAKEKEEERKKQRAEALEKIKRDNERKAALDRIQKNMGADPVVIKGNQLSAGTALEGKEASNPSEIYQSTLQMRIRENWELPPWIQRQNLRALVRIFIDANGRIIRIMKVQLSGNPQFDSQVEKSLIEAQPFPPPPVELQSTLINNGVSIGFPL